MRASSRSVSQATALMISAGVMLLLSACAGVDVSVMDSAETLGKSKISVSSNLTMGIDMGEWSYEEASDLYDEDYPRDSIHPMMYPELKFGLTDDIDISMRGGPFNDPASAKLIIKKRIIKQDKYSSAIAISGGALSGAPMQWEDTNYDSNQFRVYSGNLASLHTIKYSPRNHVTLAAIASYHDFSMKAGKDPRVRRNVYHAGVRVNWKHFVGKAFYILELGAEMPLSTHDYHQLQPWIGLGLGREHALRD